MTVCPFITEISVLISELQTLVALSEPSQVLTLAQRVLEKTGQFDISITITDEEGKLLEAHGVNLWNCATTHLLKTSSASSMDETRATLYHIGYKLLSESYKNIFESDINVLLQLLEMVIFTGSQYIACQYFSHAKELLGLADQYMQKLKWQEVKKEQQPLSISHQREQCEIDLMMAFVELAARQEQWKEVQVYIQKIEETMITQLEMAGKKVDLLYYFCFKMASDFIDKKEWSHALRWTLSFCSSVKDYTQMEECLFARLAQIICIAIEGDIDTVLDVSHTHRLLDIIDGCFKNSSISFEFHYAKLLILLAGSQPFLSRLEMAFFDMMETLDIITEENYPMTRRLGTLLIHLAQKISLKILVSGLNLYFQRCLGSHPSQESDMHFQQLYLFKFYVFSECISRTSHSADTSSQYQDTVKMIMEEMYLVKHRLTSEDLWRCQIIIWSIGDTFFKNKNYSYALPWYKQIWSFGLTSLKEDINMLVLARKLAACCIHLGDLNHASMYMETSISDSGVTIMSRDYLLSLEISTSLKDTIKADQYLDLLLYAQGFTTEILVSAAYICYKAENGEQMQKILDHAFDLRSEHIDQEPFLLRLMTLLRWAIRLFLNAKSGSNSNSSGLLVNKNIIVKYLEKAATCFASLIGHISKELKADREWVLRTGWNLALQLYGREHETEGSLLFAAITKIICSEIHQGTLNDQHLSCLFACLASRLFSSSFHEMNEPDRISLCSDSIALVKEVLDKKPGIDDHISIVALIQTQCYASLNMFEKAADILKHYSEKLKGPANLPTLDMFERSAGIILERETCPQAVATQVLEVVSATLQHHHHLGNEVIEKWAKWNRLYVSMAMMQQQTKDDIFNFITQLCVSLSTTDGISYPQKELHYLVIITWNEGMIRCHNSGVDQGGRWCRLAHDLLRRLDSSHNALKDQINRAFWHIKNSSET